MPERLLDSLLDLADLAAEDGEPPAGGIQHLAPAIEAPVDRDGESREFANTLPKPAQPRKLVADPGDPLIKVADRAEGLDRLGQLLGLEDAPNLGASHQLADVVQSAEGGRKPAPIASTISVVSDCRLWISPGSTLGSICRAAILPSEQAARAATSVRTFSKSSSSSE